MLSSWELSCSRWMELVFVPIVDAHRILFVGGGGVDACVLWMDCSDVSVQYMWQSKGW
jgi:hypothetical protein